MSTYAESRELSRVLMRTGDRVVGSFVIVTTDGRLAVLTPGNNGIVGTGATGAPFSFGPQANAFLATDSAALGTAVGMATNTLAGRLASGEPDDLPASDVRTILGNEGPQKASDETVNNSTTLQDDDDLTEAVDANTDYDLELHCRVTGNITPDWKFKIDLPSGATIFGAYVWADRISTPPAIDEYTIGQTKFLALSITSLRHVLTLSARVSIAGTAGNCTLQWAQTSAHASDTKVLTGSYMSLRGIN